MYNAVKLCGVVDAMSVESCGQSTGRSPEHSAARKAVINMFNARAAFMRSCQATDRYLDDCPYMAEYHMIVGFNRALAEEPANPPTRQSSTQR